MVGRVGIAQMSAVAIVNQLLSCSTSAFRRFGRRGHFCRRGGIFATQYAGAHDHKGVRDCFRVRMISLSMLACALAVFIALPKQLIGMYLRRRKRRRRMRPQRSVSHGLPDCDVSGCRLRRNAGLAPARRRARWARNAAPDAGQRVAILVNLVFNYFLIFGKCGFLEEA